jgi:hypothetical protein
LILKFLERNFPALFGLTANNLTAKHGKAIIAIIGVTGNQLHEKVPPVGLYVL